MATRQTLRPKPGTSRSTAQLNHGKNTAGTVGDKGQGNVGPPAFEPLLRRSDPTEPNALLPSKTARRSEPRRPDVASAEQDDDSQPPAASDLVGDLCVRSGVPPTDLSPFVQGLLVRAMTCQDSSPHPPQGLLRLLGEVSR
jgi:hypothetical protein